MLIKSKESSAWLDSDASGDYGVKTCKKYTIITLNSQSVKYIIGDL